MLHHTFKILAAFAIAAATISPLHAGVTVVMDNGDSLSGELLGSSESSLRLKVEYLGEIEIPKNRVSNLDKILDAPSEEPVADSSEESKSLEPPIAQTLIESSLETGLTGYASYLKNLVPFPEWDKRLQLGMTAQSGRKDKSDFYYRYNMSQKREKSQLRFNANYYYGKTAETKTSDKFATDFRWRRDIAPGVFYESSTSYLADEIKLIDANIEQKFGLGTRFIESEEMTFSTGLGASGRWRDFGNKQDETTYLVDLFQDWDYRISERLRLRQDLRFAMPLEENEDYEYNFTASLVSELTEAINLSLRYELGYDNSLRDDLREDRRFVSSLGYTF